MSDTEFLLDASAYTDPGWFRLEQERLFARSWALVADADSLRRPGDFVTTSVGGAPLVLVVGDDGTLRAFHNLCRHRGMRMVDGEGSGCSTIRCSYHDWRYGLDGELRVVPQRSDQFPGLDVAMLGLLPASVGIWEGQVFACPDPDVTPLETWMTGWTEEVGSVRPASLRLVASADVSASCNWKLLVENHIDVYHLWYLHAESLREFDHRKFEHRSVGPHWVSYEPRRTDHGEVDAPAIRHLDARDRNGLGAHLLFPSVLFAVAAEFFISYAVVPEGADRSRLELRLRAEPDADADALLAVARSFIDEDITACERIQEGLGSPWFSVGPLAQDHEAPISAFHRRVLAALDPDRGDNP